MYLGSKVDIHKWAPQLKHVGSASLDLQGGARLSSFPIHDMHPTPTGRTRTLDQDDKPLAFQQAMAGETINYDARLKSLSMLVVMGSSGAGKSHFVNTLAGRQVTAEGRGLQSCASNPPLSTVVPLLMPLDPQVPPSASLLWSNSETDLSWSSTPLALTTPDGPTEIFSKRSPGSWP